MTISSEELKEILEKHSRWLRSVPDGVRANLFGANLSRANLSGANLSRANLSGANLSRANLSEANLSRANLSGANLSRANLSGANLSRANLSGANLSRANLSWANLYGADLSWVNGNMREIKTIKVDTYPVVYTDKVIQIGCENHAIKEWFEFTDKEILAMDGKKALKFWRKWKPILRMIIIDER